jgi:hypothetical protein
MLDPAAGQISLADGTPIVLRALDQWLFHGGQLEGYPTRERNAEAVRDAVAATEARWKTKGLLIPPVETLILWEHETRALLPPVSAVVGIAQLAWLEPPSQTQNSLPSGSVMRIQLVSCSWI